MKKKDNKIIYAKLWEQQEKENELQKLAMFDKEQKDVNIRAERFKEDIEEVDVTFERQNGRVIVVTRECKKGNDKAGSVREAIKNTMKERREMQGK